MVPTAAPGAGEVTEPSGKAVILVLSYDCVVRVSLSASIARHSEGLAHSERRG